MRLSVWRAWLEHFHCTRGSAEQTEAQKRHADCDEDETENPHRLTRRHDVSVKHRGRTAARARFAFDRGVSLEVLCAGGETRPVPGLPVSRWV